MLTGSQLKSLLAAIFFKISLDLAYYLLVQKIEYYAISGLNLNIPKLVESYFLALSVLIYYFITQKSSVKLSRYMLWLLLSLSYIPMLTIYAFRDESRIFMYSTTAFWLGVFLLIRLLPSINLRPLRKSDAKNIYIGLLILLTPLSFTVLYEPGLLSGGLLIQGVPQLYEHRQTWIEELNVLARYPVYWVMYSFVPILFSLSVVNRKWGLTIVLSLIQILLGFVVGVKNALMLLPFVAGLIFIVRRRTPLAWIGVGLGAIVLSGVIAYYLFEYPQIYLFMIARLLLVPAQLSFFYYDYFSTHGLIPFAYIFNFFLKLAIVDYPYDLNPANLIGEIYYGRPNLSAVSGIIADAYMNLGFVGFILWAFALVMILKVADACSKGLDIRISIAGIAMGVSSITGTYLIRSLFTAGLFVSLLLLYLLRSMRKVSIQK